ncbi:unnamed protein product [Parnassius apollo]|uniref:(apollo) hypothetical protein n=1 Tax=Parnassius apollo TaxID=110799 RepID=A0A8S3Y8H1_PARAO|nr:unnamed protein product [Parnassius apollo]
MSGAGAGIVNAPPLSAAEALSSLLWQPYECRSPPLPRSSTDGVLAVRRGAGASPECALQSPSGGRHARASYATYRATTYEMRLPVPAPAPLCKSDSVSVRVPGEPSQANVSSVNIVQVDAPPGRNVNSAVQTERERSVVSAECQTEEPARRRRPRRARAPRAPELESVPPPPYSTLPPPVHPVPVAVPVPVPPAPIVAPHPPAHRFPFQPIPLRCG